MAWHLLEDVLGWVAVLVASAVLLFWEVYVLDPILSILITLYILWNVLRNLRRTAALFLQAVPENYDLEAIERSLVTLPNVKSIHKMHLWSLDGEHHVLTTHVVVDEHTSKARLVQLKREIQALLRSLRVEHTTLELEYEQEDFVMK
jgi:cobalt-zinc-cadmium efflux system protein